MSIINLLPEDYIKRRQRQRANMLCLGLFVVVMVAVGGAAFVTERSNRYTTQVANRVDAAYLEAGKLIEQLQQLEGQKQRMLHKAELASRLLERVPRSTLLAAVTNALPHNASLTQFNITPKQIIANAPPTRKESAESKFQKIQDQRMGQPQSTTVFIMEATGLAGTDVDVAKFIANLISNPLLTGVDLVYSQEKVVEGRMVREFQVRMEVKPDIDVMDFTREDGQSRPGDALSAAVSGNGARS